MKTVPVIINQTHQNCPKNMKLHEIVKEQKTDPLHFKTKQFLNHQSEILKQLLGGKAIQSHGKVENQNFDCKEQKRGISLPRRPNLGSHR